MARQLLRAGEWHQEGYGIVNSPAVTSRYAGNLMQLISQYEVQ
jgi:hypothetical protein